MKENLILVDEQDREIGILDKWNVHVRGLLHRAFSAFIFNSKGELLLQQRADQKYHSGGLWTNTCCSHPLTGETTDSAVNRRLMEEMGLECVVDFQFKFQYKTAFDNGLIEHELDHVYFGLSDTKPIPNPQEVKNWEYISLEVLQRELEQHPERYSAWLKICFPQVLQFAKGNVN